MRTPKRTSTRTHMRTGRKFWAFIISLVAICVCAKLGMDVSIGIGTIFGIYCAGNVGTKMANNKEH